MAGSQRKLANEQFLSKASPEVVQKERDRLAACEEEMNNVETAWQRWRNTRIRPAVGAGGT